MKLVDAQKILGRHMQRIDKGDMSLDERKSELQDAMAIVSLAKQMVNLADVNLRIEMAEEQGKLPKNASVLEYVR